MDVDLQPAGTAKQWIKEGKNAGCHHSLLFTIFLPFAIFAAQWWTR